MNMIQKKQYNLPALRFSEFSAPWEQKKLGDIFTFKNGINADKSKYGFGYKFINVLDIIADNPITFDSIIGKVSISENEFKKNEVVFGDILFQRSSETREDVGQSNVYLDQNQSATFGGFVIRGHPIVKINSRYFDALLKTSKARKDITTRSGGSTRYNVGQGSLSAVTVNVSSSHHEQQKIALFTSSVDKKIEQLGLKKKYLKQYKKGIIQKLFTETLRFKDVDGNNFPNWETSTLNEYLTLKSKRNLASKISFILSVSNKSGFIAQTSQFEGHRVASKDVSNYKIVELNDFAYNPSRINVGSIARLKLFNDGIVSPMYVVFKLKNGLLAPFFEAFIDTHYFKHLVKIGCSGSVRDSLNFDELLKFKVVFPCIEEQQKIAGFLSSIEQKISLVSTELDHAKTFKKGLLQQMFI